MLAPERFAAVSLVTSRQYVIGAMVLGHSLRRTGWRHDTLLMVTSEVPRPDREKLGRYWQHLVEVPLIENPNPEDEQGTDYFGTTYTKLRVWEQTEYSKLVYLDADTIVLNRLDELLSCPRFGAAPCMGALDMFNTGVMVVEPSKETLEDMVSKIGELTSYDGSDQGFLNSYYADWYSGPQEHRLPTRYNVPAIFYLYNASWTRLRDEICVLHFFGPRKPWKVKSRVARAIHKRFVSSIYPTPKNGGLSPFELWWDAQTRVLAAEAAL